jgi:hypothetical protein
MHEDGVDGFVWIVRRTPYVPLHVALHVAGKQNFFEPAHHGEQGVLKLKPLKGAKLTCMQ